MRTLNCDRCGKQIDDDDKRQVSINRQDGEMDIVCEDACKKCVAALRKFFAPLPQEASPRGTTENG